MPATTSHLEAPSRRRIPMVAACAAVLVCAALTSIVWGLGGQFHITVDRVDRVISPGATISDLAVAHYTRGRPGSLFSINGGIIAMTGGDPVAYVRNGRIVPGTQRVFDGDVVASHSGADRTERAVSVKESIDPTATIQGIGPILKVVRPGTPGVMLVRKGVLSGEIDETRVLVPARSIVLVASMPTSRDKIVALTFDDGPWPVQTEKILAILKAAGVRATFFELGQQVKRYPGISAKVVAAGSVVGNHSWSHPFLTRLKPAQVPAQIVDAAAAIKTATRTSPTSFRPPYGAINNTVWAQAKAAHESIALWDVDTLDWTKPGVTKIVDNVKRHVGRASIVLMHDGGGDRSQTIAALPSMIGWLKSQGYTFLTVPELQAVR